MTRTKTTRTILVLSALALVGCGDDTAALDTAGAISGTFTREDHNRCMAWPICPDGVVSNPDQTRLRVFPTACRAETGFPITCGACIDTRAPACAPFVGTCIAPNWPQSPVDHCENRVAPVNPGGTGWTICTGAAQDPSGNAQTVCGD